MPIGTVPDLLDDHRAQASRTSSDEVILETLEHQAQQGVDYFTIHAGVLREHLPLRARAG